MENKKNGHVWRQIAAAAAIVAVIVITGIFYPTAPDEESYDNAAWMAGVNDTTKLSEINIPGTHDSSSLYIFPQHFLQTQDTDITQQLLNGYRFLDIRVELGNDGLEMCHSFGRCRTKANMFSKTLKFREVTQKVKEFLEQYPSETVIFCIKAENSDDDVSMVSSQIKEIIEEDPNLWYTGTTIPTMEQARGKIVVARRYEADYGMNFEWDDQGSDIYYQNPMSESQINDTEYLEVQDRYNYDTNSKLKAVEYSLENCPASEDTFVLNYLSTTNGSSLPYPRKYANELNGALNGLSLTQGKYYGTVIVDFADSETADKIIESNILQ